MDQKLQNIAFKGNVINIARDPRNVYHKIVILCDINNIAFRSCSPVGPFNLFKDMIGVDIAIKARS